MNLCAGYIHMCVCSTVNLDIARTYIYMHVCCACLFMCVSVTHMSTFGSLYGRCTFVGICVYKWVGIVIIWYLILDI